jgi:integrase
MFRVCGERVRYLTPDEEKGLFEKLDGCEWLKGIVLIALHTGMRRGEICGLQWFDLNFERGLIHVRNTKNGKDRLIPMNATVRTLLENQAKTSSYVFPSPRTKERLVEIKYSFVRAVKAAKITDLRFHDLRHTAATRMGDAGADALTLAIFGWSDIRMAMRYTHAMEDAKRRAVEAIAVGTKTNAGETPALPVSRDHSVTNEKPVADQIAVSG